MHTDCRVAYRDVLVYARAQWEWVQVQAWTCDEPALVYIHRSALRMVMTSLQCSHWQSDLH